MCGIVDGIGLAEHGAEFREFLPLPTLPGEAFQRGVQLPVPCRSPPQFQAEATERALLSLKIGKRAGIWCGVGEVGSAAEACMSLMKVRLRALTKSWRQCTSFLIPPWLPNHKEQVCWMAWPKA